MSGGNGKTLPIVQQPPGQLTDGGKPASKSMTIRAAVGAIAAGVVGLAAAFGQDVSAPVAQWQQVVVAVTNAAAVVFGTMATIGRMRATKKISGGD